MPDITITFASSEKVAVRCYAKNAHLVLKIGELTLIFAAGLLPAVRDAITECLKQNAKVAKKKTPRKRRS